MLHSTAVIGAQGLTGQALGRIERAAARSLEESLALSVLKQDIFRILALGASVTAEAGVLTGLSQLMSEATLPQGTFAQNAAVVDSVAAGVLRDLGGGVQAFGSTSLTSDYDISFTGPMAELAQFVFAARMSHGFGMASEVAGFESARTLDTNAYTDPIFDRFKGGPDDVRFQDMFANLAARKYLPDKAWNQYREWLLANAPDASRSEVRRMLDSVEAMHAGFETRAAQKAAEIDAQSRTGTGEIRLDDGLTPGRRAEDVQVKARDLLYKQSLKKIVDLMEQYGKATPGAGPGATRDMPAQAAPRESETTTDLPAGPESAGVTVTQTPDGRVVISASGPSASGEATAGFEAAEAGPGAAAASSGPVRPAHLRVVTELLVRRGMPEDQAAAFARDQLENQRRPLAEVLDLAQRVPLDGSAQAAPPRGLRIKALPVRGLSRWTRPSSPRRGLPVRHGQAVHGGHAPQGAQHGGTPQGRRRVHHRATRAGAPAGRGGPGPHRRCPLRQLPRRARGSGPGLFRLEAEALLSQAPGQSLSPELLARAARIGVMEARQAIDLSERNLLLR